MRPDQHKKKKNSDYKKKHGISIKKGEKHVKNEQTGRHRSDEASASSDEPKARVESDEADVDDLPAGNQERGNFSRRKLESNWDRYKEEDYEEGFDLNSTSAVSSVPIGADYQSLLDKAMSTSSHFQFKSEKEWENPESDEINIKAGSSLMSIDCHALAQSLKSIPLPQRLEIDKKYFKDEYPRSTTTNGGEADKPTANRSNSELKQKLQQKNVVAHSDSKNFGLSQLNRPTKASDEAGKKEDPTVQLKSQQRSLLLDLENCKEKVRKNGGSVNLLTTKSAVEDDLELLLGSDNAKDSNSALVSSHINTADATARVQQPHTAGETKEDLEDWLDSILD